jgi:hypothetical protein
MDAARWYASAAYGIYAESGVYVGREGLYVVARWLNASGGRLLAAAVAPASAEGLGLWAPGGYREAAYYGYAYFPGPLVASPFYELAGRAPCAAAIPLPQWRAVVLVADSCPASFPLQPPQPPPGGLPTPLRALLSCPANEGKSFRELLSELPAAPEPRPHFAR